MTASPLVRVVKGSLTDEELAALTAVVLWRAAANGPAAHARPRSTARWQRPERRPAYSPPHSWHFCRPGGTPQSGHGLPAAQRTDA
jgi:Acyl-CoA carboxylase epsilon subunit